MSYLNNKQRLLKIMEVLEKETDEDHEVSINDLISKLKVEYGSEYKVGKKAIKDDINTLISTNYDLIENTDKIGEKYFSRQNRNFENYELRMLIDAIYSARFINRTDREKLVRKIKSLTSEHLARKVENKIYIDDHVVCETKELKINIDKLHTALQERKFIKFKYGRYNTKKKFVESRNGEYNSADPYGLVWNDGFYYLVAWNESRREIINYRVDRMRKVSIENRPSEKQFFDLAEHGNRCFNMYPGEVSLIKIKFDNHLINAIIDRFGKNVEIEIPDEDSFILVTRAAINTGLIRWILNWGSDAQVLYPQSLIESIKEESEKIYNIYNR